MIKDAESPCPIGECDDSLLWSTGPLDEESGLCGAKLEGSEERCLRERETDKFAPELIRVIKGREECISGEESFLKLSSCSCREAPQELSRSAVKEREISLFPDK